MKKLIAIATIVLLAGCWLAPTNEVVVVAGDSIAEQATRPINFALLRQDNAPLVVSNAIGGTLLKGTGYICGRLASLHQFVVPDRMVLVFGTNDALAGSTTFQQDIDGLMSCVDPSTTVYWVPPYVSAQYTQYVLDAVVTWPNITPVVFVPTQAQLQADNIHLNAAGNAALVDALEQAGAL